MIKSIAKFVIYSCLCPYKCHQFNLTNSFKEKRNSKKKSMKWVTWLLSCMRGVSLWYPFPSGKFILFDQFWCQLIDSVGANAERLSWRVFTSRGISEAQETWCHICSYFSPSSGIKGSLPFTLPHSWWLHLFSDHLGNPWVITQVQL